MQCCVAPGIAHELEKGKSMYGCPCKNGAADAPARTRNSPTDEVQPWQKSRAGVYPPKKWVSLVMNVKDAATNSRHENR